MDTPQIIAPPRAPSGGVVHMNVRHTSHFTVVGNHLAQHPGLSLTAIGLATHIQSLPAGAKIGIKCLAERFPESETRIAGALRELETYGYLKRTRERLPSGRVVTRTTSFNKPGIAPSRPPCPAPAGPPPVVREEPAPRPAAPAKPMVTGPADLLPTASEVLARLRLVSDALPLSSVEVRTLAPAVAAWLERGVTPEAVTRALTTGLPAPLKHPARFLEHRLTTRLPAPLPPAVPVVPHDPLQNCDGCDRAFRAPEPGHCTECRWERPATA
ncbi:helix-turn-helix domain-containing protein [Streptomyces sp. ITFR-16]|uniref:helix-turn-helix domain-containing protein n=1 Tax=Streptomyces sp. ITFR-16 TaxID=3075198 RepID=UPI002889818D|nr:helix-turn-helix domain-containing protein [Streptomyces sp. ITFR-16]WNI26912.1 helix-turn-helix domain-containing protein [Streptomyces sp. ITFR-16]